MTTEDNTEITLREEGKKDISMKVFVKVPDKMVRDFTRYYIEQGFENGAEAARKAGSTSKNPNHIAYQWLQNPWVKEEIAKAKRDLGMGINPLESIREDDVVSKLIRVFEGALEDKKYEPALKAVELMGKQIGMFKRDPAGSAKVPDPGEDPALLQLLSALKASKKIEAKKDAEEVPKVETTYKEV